MVEYGEHGLQNESDISCFQKESVCVWTGQKMSKGFSGKVNRIIFK
jgi:hypothetical protein